MKKLMHGERLRMCACCRTMKPKNELFRVVLADKKNPVLDLTLKVQGRGAYICKDAECVKKAQKRKALERSLSCGVSPEIYNEMSDLLEKI